MAIQATADRPATSDSPAGADWLEWAGRARPFAARLGNLKQAVFDHVTPAAQPFLAALCARRHGGRTWVLVPDLRRQENVFNDLVTWHGSPVFFPQLEAPVIDAAVLPDPDVVSERLALLHALAGRPADAAADPVPEVIVLVAESLDEDVPAPREIRERELRLALGLNFPMSDFIARLDSAGYDRVPVVSERGQFAVRGGIVDVFSWQASAPVRIEFLDREIESLRTFDVNSQTSVGRQREAVILLDRQGGARQFVKLRHYIGPDDLIIALECAQESAAHVHIAEGVFDEGAGAAGEENFDTACHEHPLGTFGTGDFVLQEARRKAFRDQLGEWRDARWRIVMFFNNEGEIERFREIFPDLDGIDCRLGQLNHGFTIPSARLAILCDAEMFGRYQHARARRLFNRERQELGRRRGADPNELEDGDLVVHHDYGIARFRGLGRSGPAETGSDASPAPPAAVEVMVLEFADRARLYVPLDQAHLVARYVGTGKRPPELSRLGDDKWSKARLRAERSILDYAARLLAVQAERETHTRPPHPADNKWQWEFENAFIYKETPDQMRAIQESKGDMETDRPMDRLICGDVGFGKTEVAIRAAFKCVMGGRQAVFLAPTTVLAEQHWRTLRERMSDYPIRIDLLCRWRSTREQNETLRGLADGSVDIVVGTHRLLSADVIYKSPGLAVIDEEQRFGVKHKERFKQAFRLIDVLTLSATPIPRTLYLALMGARDMSAIETPPPNRVPVRTHICAYDERVIRDSITRELKRGGQVFFLHNRVADIERIASRLRELCPGARIDIGHGQMAEDELEEAMRRFVDGRSDVFVCTTIIESGIDIPNANTIIIDRADRFGLADLYQLRGRVGRAGHQAYAYLMLPRDLLTTGDARKRINAIRQYSTLGAGFKIAMRDLEIRGAGNLLGLQQSGHIFNIGFELYCQLLKHAVARLKGSRSAARVELAFRCDFLVTGESEWHRTARADGSVAPAFIPASYLADPRLRVAAYRELAELASPADLTALIRAWRDRFGAFPEPVENLLRVAELKITAAAAGFSALEIREGKLMLTRRGSFVLIGGKFPRLTPSSGWERLVDAIRMVKQF